MKRFVMLIAISLLTTAVRAQMITASPDLTIVSAINRPRDNNCNHRKWHGKTPKRCRNNSHIAFAEP